MVRGMHLPFRAIEGTSVVGPFFWSSFDQDDEDPHLRMLSSHTRYKSTSQVHGIHMSHPVYKLI